MEEQFGLKYRGEIEAIEDRPDFEKLGDEKFLHHPDPEARMTWAFYRPSGSEPSQIEDENELVSIMAFNNSRLRPLERFAKLHPYVLADEKLRVRVAKRARMLFRALADEDFIELVEVVKLYPFYKELACDQVINGRKMLEEVKADIVAASEFLELVEEFVNEKLLDAVIKKIVDFGELDSAQMREFLDEILEKKKQLGNLLCTTLKEKALERVEEFENLHSLQKIAMKKKIAKLVE